MIEQNSSDPEGVSGDPASHKALRLARHRKAKSALALKLAGATWGEIAHALGYPTERTALLAVEKALNAELDDTDRDTMRRFAGMRLERLLRAAWSKAIDEDNPEQMIALSKAREVIADHRRLFGLDAPTEVIVHQPTRAELEEWVARMASASGPRVIEEEIIDVDWEDVPPELEVG